VDALLGPWAPDPDRVGVARVVRTGESQIAAEASAAAALVPSGDAERERLVTQLGVAGYVSVPMLFNARPFGALTLVVADARRRFADGDVALVETLARMAGLAVANARLEHELADTHRRQDDLLAALSHQLRTPLTAMLRRSSHVVRPATISASATTTGSMPESNIAIQIATPSTR